MLAVVVAATSLYASAGSQAATAATEDAVRAAAGDSLVARVADRAGIGPAQARRALADPGFRAAPDGTGWFVDDFDEGREPLRQWVPPSPEGGGSRSARVATVPAWHSDPGAALTIFLDVQPASLKHTRWNESTTIGIARDTYAGWSLDADPAISEPELIELREIWRGTAEAFGAFDVDVTTARPDDADLLREGPGDQRFGSWVVLSSDPRLHRDACGQGCGGMAMLGTFDRTDASQLATPALIFAGGWETVAHEVGHQLGLSHDGLDVPGQPRHEYHRGTPVWSPIMGAGTSTLVQWSRGEYAGATNTEDDLAVMAAHGLPERTDEAPAAPGPSAPPLPEAMVALGRDDVDVFALPACTGVREVAVEVAPGSGLDADLELLDAAGRVIGGDRDAVTELMGRPWGRVSGQSASVVDSSGRAAFARVVPGSADGPQGYSAYGAVGRYRLADSCGAALPASPTGLTAVPTGGGAIVSWTAPPGVVTGYTVRLGNHTAAVSPGVRVAQISSFGASGSATVSVSATNRAGASPPATTSVDLLPIPEVEDVDVVLDGSDGDARVTWSAPSDARTLEVWEVTAPLDDPYFLFEVGVDDTRSVLLGSLPTNGSLQAEVCGAVLGFQGVRWSMGCSKSSVVSLPRIASTPKGRLSVTTPSSSRPAGAVSLSVSGPDQLGEGSFETFRYALDDRPWVRTDDTTIDLTETVGTGWHRLRVQAVTTVGAGQTALFTFGHTRIPSAVRDLAVVPGEEPGSLVATWQPPEDARIADLSAYRIEVWSSAAPVPIALQELPAGQTSRVLTGLAPGSYRVTVRAVNEFAPEFGAGPPSTASATVSDAPDELRPGSPTLERVALSRRGRVLTARWTPASSGGPVQQWVVQLRGNASRGRSHREVLHSEQPRLRVRVPSGFQWKVRVRAIGPGGNSSWSSWRAAG